MFLCIYLDMVNDAQNMAASNHSLNGIGTAVIHYYITEIVPLAKQNLILAKLNNTTMFLNCEV